MKIHRKIVAVLFSLAVLFSVSVSACADMGPKPYIKITFRNADAPYYSTILARGDFMPPAGIKFTDSDYDSELFLALDPGMQDAVRAFAEYEAPEDYNYFGWRKTWDSSDPTIELGYMPPDDFVVLVYFPDSGIVAESPVCHTYAFGSYFTADLSGQGLSVQSGEKLAVEPVFPVGTWLVEFGARALITVAVELIVALLFGYWEKRTMLFFAVVNLATQVILNIILTLVSIQYGFALFLIMYFFGELIVLTLEAVLYALLIGKYSKHHQGKLRAVFYAITANAVSFLAGVIFSANFIDGQ